MRLIHCADLHLDAKMTSLLPKEQAKERRSELLLTFQRMVSFAAENGVSAVLLCGDLFDTKNVSVTAKNVVRETMEAHPQITFFYLKGNHDTAADGVAASNVKTFDDAWRAYSLGEKTVLYGLELTEENAAGAANALLPDPTKVNIVMLHGQIVKSTSKKQAESISLKEYKNKGIDYLALGHIHAFQTGALDARGRFCYPGCLEGRGFDECGPKGFVLLDVNEETGEVQTEFVPFASRQLFCVEADLTGAETPAQVGAAVQAALRSAGPKEADLVKIVLTGAVDVEQDVDLAYLKKSVERGYYFVKISDETPASVDALRVVLDASLTG